MTGGAVFAESWATSPLQPIRVRDVGEYRLGVITRA